MQIKIGIEVKMKNGDSIVIEVGEKDPKGILRDTTTGEEREITLTDKEVLMEYTKRISNNIEEGKPLFFMGLDQQVSVINSLEVSNINLKITEVV